VTGQFAIVEFVDALGESWRRRSDTQKLEATNRPVTAVHDWFQRSAARSRLFLWLLHEVPLYWAMEGAWLDPAQRPSWSTRWVRWTWGKWPIGERDPWERPDGAPPLWHLDDMPPLGTPTGHMLRNAWRRR
jgi:hypothetical protein